MIVIYFQLYKSKFYIKSHRYLQKVQLYQKMSQFQQNNQAASLCSASNYEGFRLDHEQQNDFHSISKIYNQKIIRKIESQKKMTMLYNHLVKNNQVIPQKDSNKKEEKVRKTRKDKQGRKHICGACNLGYLSYPALYTHIKTKHGKQIPAGTIRGENGKAKKRGRPKNRQNPMLYDQLEQEKKTFPQELVRCVKKQQLKILEEFDFQTGNQQQTRNNTLQSKYFVGMLKQIKKQVKPVLKLMRISHLITVFLYNCKDFFDSDALLSFEQTFHELVVFINQNYKTILTDYQNQSDLYVEIDQSYPDFKSQFLKSEYQKTYCYCQPPEFLPYFIERFIKKHIHKQDEQQKKLFLMDFSNWLYENKFTCLKLQKNRAQALI